MANQALTGKLKPYAQMFPPDEELEVPKEGLSAQSAHLLGALFKLKGRGVEMTVERISLH